MKIGIIIKIVVIVFYIIVVVILISCISSVCKNVNVVLKCWRFLFKVMLVLSSRYVVRFKKNVLKFEKLFLDSIMY